jgi:hypothetical protein
MLFNAAAAVAGTATTGLAAGLATPSMPDPIFAAIERYDAAVKARNTVLGTEADEDAWPTYKSWKKASDKADNDEYAAVDELFETEPTTILGVAALLETLGRERDEEDDGDDSSIMDWEYGSGGLRRRADDFLVELAEVLRRLGREVRT